MQDVVLFSVCIAAAGCAAGTPISAGTIGVAPANAAHLVIYRPAGFAAAVQSPAVHINGAPVCDLPNGGGFSTDVSPGKVTVSVSLWASGTSTLSRKAETATVYFVEMGVRGAPAYAALSGRLIGLGIEEATSNHAGPFDIGLTDEATALNSGVKLTACGR
jgi:hypothetical protein